MTGTDRLALYDLYAAYGALIDAADWDAWLGLFAAACQYQMGNRDDRPGLPFARRRAVLAGRVDAIVITVVTRFVGRPAGAARRLVDPLKVIVDPIALLTRRIYWRQQVDRFGSISKPQIYFRGPFKLLS